MDLRISELQRRCMSSIIEHLIRLNRTNSIKDLPLPPLMLQQIEGIHEWKDDLSNMLPVDCPLAAQCISNAPLFSAHFRWTSENKIARRATAAAQLDNLDPTSASQSTIEFGFVLASTYCLEHHARRLWQHCKAVRLLSSDHNSNMVNYWTRALSSVPNQIPNAYVHWIRSQKRGSDQFWLDVSRSYWPIIEQLNEFDRRDWIQYELTDAMKYRHKSCAAFVWSRYTEDMRNMLVIEAIRGTYDSKKFLKSTISANEKEIFLEFLEQFDDADARCFVIWRHIDELFADFIKKGDNLEMFERLLGFTTADLAYFSFDDIARPICKRLLAIWDSFSPTMRAEVSNENSFDDLFRCAIKLGFVNLASCIWIEEREELRKFEMVFRDECIAFRMCCANGYFELVQQFWEWASTEQRCRLIACKFGEALKTAAQNGHLTAIRYLWENMNSRVACEAISSNGLDPVSLSQLIMGTPSSNNADGSHELEDFLAVFISTSQPPADKHRSTYPSGAMKEILVAALSLGNGKALDVLLQRTKGRGDPTVLRMLVQAFNDEQRLRLRSKLTTEDDVKVCGLDTIVRSNTEHVAGNESIDDGEGDEGEEEDEEVGEMIDLIELDEYYDG